MIYPLFATITFILSKQSITKKLVGIFLGLLLTIPFIIFSSSRSPEHQAEARRRGAVGCTNDSTELFVMVVSTLQRR